MCLIPEEFRNLSVFMRRPSSSQRPGPFSFLAQYSGCFSLLCVFVIVFVTIHVFVCEVPKVPLEDAPAFREFKVGLPPQDRWSQLRGVWNQTYKAPSFSPDEELVNFFPDHVTFFLDEPDFCHRQRGRVLALAGVITAIKHQENRRFVRNTWGHPNLTLLTGIYPIFVLGISSDEEDLKMIREESRVHRDIIQANFTDTYWNLTYKTLSLLEWMDRRCRSPLFLLKIDDDVFPNPQALADYLSVLVIRDPGPPRIMGKVKGNDPVLRSGKWAVTEDEFAPNSYPPFVGGPSYVIPSVLIPVLLKAARRTRWLHLEDVYLTGLVAQRANISHKSVASLTNSNSNPEEVRAQWESSARIFQENIALSQAAKSWNELLKRENITVVEPYDPSANS